MPHQCTTCGHTFEDGSKEMLDGCPDCGGNTFQFHPPGTDLPDDPPADSDPPERDDPTGASAVGRAATRVREFVSGDPGSGDPSNPDDSGDPLSDPTGEPVPTSDDGVDAPGAAGSDDPGAAAGSDEPGEVEPDTPRAVESDTTSATGTDPSVDAESRAGRPSGEVDRSSGGESAQPSSGRDRPSSDRSRTPSRNPSPEPDPNAPWPTEANDPPGSGGDAARRSDAGADDIIDADARETERAIGDPEGASGTSPDTPPSASDPETPSASGGEPSDSGLVRSGTAPSDAAPDESADVRSGAGGSPDSDDPDSDEGGLAAAESAPAGEGQVVSEPSDDQPDLADLREQLNEQFESIKILEPGQYELNLMELYDREEYIIALQENGRYVIQVPENWMGDRPGDE